MTDPNGQTIQSWAVRSGRSWVVHVTEHGVYGHGRTLGAARENTEQGLAQVAQVAAVVLTPTTAELQTLRAAEATYQAAAGCCLDQGGGRVVQARGVVADVMEMPSEFAVAAAEVQGRPSPPGAQMGVHQCRLGGVKPAISAAGCPCGIPVLRRCRR
ncbi:hypothetical protein [Streptodolium elevatio]